NAPLIDAAERRPAISRELSSVIARLLERDPGARTSSAAEVESALRVASDALAGEAGVDASAIARSAPTALAEGTVVAERFRLVREIGRGAMGCVWLAEHLGLGVRCAVKLMLDERSGASALAARFEREAKAVAALKSRHVVQVLDHGVWAGRPYIAMEHLDGE